MNNVFCINTNLPNVEKLVKDVKSDLNNLLNEKQIALLWNKWVELNNENLDKLPTSENIKNTYGILANIDKEEFIKQESLSEKSEVLDAIQYYYFEGLAQATGKKTVERADIIKYQNEVFEQIPEIFKDSQFGFVADNFKNYKDYFIATRLNKFQQPDVDLDELEGKQKDTIGENSSIYTDNKNNCSDEVVYLIASLTTDETVFGLPKPVNFDQTWNTIQNLLGNSIGDLNFQVKLLIESNEPFVPELLQKLDVVDGKLLAENADNHRVRTSFVEAFAKQQQDISITDINGKDSYSAIDGQEKASFKNNAKSLFWASDIVHKVNGKIVLNKEKYNKLKFNNTPESLKEFLALFGINFQGEMSPENITDASIVREMVNKYLAANELEWLDFQSKDYNVSARVMNLIGSQLPYVKKNKNLSVKNAEGKTQNSASNHNYFSKLFSKFLNKISIPKMLTSEFANNALEQLINKGDVELNLVSGARSKDKSEASTFNNLSFPDIISTIFTGMFSSTPIIHLPRTSDKSSERTMKMLFKDKNSNMAYTNISDIVLKKLYAAFQADLKQKYHPDWKYGDKSPFEFWESLGLELILDINGKDYFPTFKTTILGFINKQQKETVQLLEEEGVIDFETKKVSFTDRALENISGTFEEKINTLVNNFNFNQLYFGILYTQMTQGSMSGTKVENMFKRFSGPVAESRTIRYDAEVINYLNEDFNKLGLDKFDAKYLKTYIHGDTLESSEDKNLIANIYRENNVDDAQGIMLLPMYKVVLSLTNQWTPKQEKLYQDIMKGKKVDKKEFKSTFPPIKPVGFSVVTINKDGVDYKAPIYIKTACYPISSIDTKGLENEDKWKHGLANGIGLYIPKSGIKMATPQILDPIYDAEGNISSTNTTVDFPIEYFGIQLDINPKTSTKQLIGTQLKKLITSNLFKHGSAIHAKYKEWVDKNIKLYEDISQIETDKLYEKAGIILVDGEPKINNYTKLKEMVSSELLERNMPINVIRSLEYIIDTNGNLNGNTIDSLPARQKIMNLLNSIVTNKLIKLNTNGTALVQISQQGWAMKKLPGKPTDEEIANIDCSIEFVSKQAKIDYYNNQLRFITKGERNGEAEILIPYKYKHYVKEDGTFDEQLLINIGYRIPTQGHNSMLHLKVVGYLPAHLDQVVVMPKEITSQGGSDFDVDKINIFIPNNIILEGKTKFISMDMNPEEIYQNKLDKLKNFLNVLDNKITKEYDKLFKDIGKDKAVDKLLGDIFGNDAFEGEFTEEEIKEILVENGFDQNSYDDTVKKIEKLNNLDNKEKWIQNFKLKQLQNEIITQTVEILEDPIVYAALTNPNNSDELKADAKKVDDILGKKSKKITLTWNNLLKGNTLLKTIYQMFAAKALVGVFASQATHHSLAQQVGLHFKSGRNFFFNHNTVEVNGEKRTSLSDDVDKDGNLISDSIGNNLLTAAVDAAKEDYLTSLGINLQTGDIVSLFKRMGGKKDYLYAWINQPIIQEYLNITKRANSMTAKSLGNDLNKSQKIELVLEKFKLKKDSLQYLTEKYDKLPAKALELLNAREAVGNYDVKKLEDSWFNNVTTNEMNIHLLDDFLYFEDASAVLRQAISTSKFDTAGPGKDVLESLLLSLKYHSFVDTMNENSGYTLATTSKEQIVDELTDQKLHKYELFPNVYANAGQREALDKLTNFLKSNEKEIILVGRGGTGKTTIIKKILETVPKSSKIGGITVAHKAKKVLGKSIGKEKVKTIASALAIKLDETTGQFVPDDFKRQQGKIPIRFMDIIIVDEASMVSDKMIDEIMTLKKPSAKVIFMGDNAQLPPIGQETDSKVFDIKNKIVLLEKMRQAKTSPIINVGTQIAENIESNSPILDILKNREGLYDTKSDSHVDFINNEETLLNNVVEDIKKSKENTNFVKVVTFNNEKHDAPHSVKNLNNKIREKLWGNKAKNQFNVGELVTAYDNYSKESGDVDEMQIYNSDDLIVTDIEQVNNYKGSISAYSKKEGNRSFDYSYNIVLLSLKDDEGNKIIGEIVPVIADSSKEKYQKDMQQLWNTDKQLAFKLQTTFANIQYGYAITSHKAQGSTYTNVYIIENNILGNTNASSVIAKNKSLYVAASRPTNKLVIFNPDKNESISDKTKKEFNKTETEQYVPEKETLNINYQAPYANIIANTLLNVFYNKSFNFVGSIYKDLVALYKNEYIKNAVKGLIYPTDLNFVVKPADSTQASLIYGAVVNYLIQSKIPLNHSLVYGDNTIPHQIIKIQKDVNHPLHNNDIIQHFFSMELSGNDGIPSISTPKNKNITTTEAADFTKAFEEIQIVDNKLYNDLVTIAMYQTGVLQSPSSFYNYLPAQSVIPLVSKAINDAMPEDSTEIAREVLSNIGNQLSNIKRVTQKQGDKLTDGRLFLKDISKADNKHFINYTKYVGEKAISEIYEFVGPYFQVLKAKNHKKLFYNFTTKSDIVELIGITEADVNTDFEQNKINEEFEVDNAVNNNYIKQGISELFESNPELANSVYEDMGFGNQITPQQKQQAQQAYSNHLESLNKPNTNPILQDNQAEQLNKFAELQNLLNNKEFIEGAKTAYESSGGLKSFGTQKQYNDYIARISLGIIPKSENVIQGFKEFVGNTKQTMWDSLEDWQKEKLNKIVLPEEFNSWNTKKQDKFIECYAKIK